MIRVLFFARLADLARVREAEFDCPGGSIRLEELLRQVVTRFSSLSTSLARPELMFLAVNQEQADLDTQVNDGDEVAIMPPFSGG